MVFILKISLFGAEESVGRLLKAERMQIGRRKMNIALASDHAGREYKKMIWEHLAAKNIDVADLGLPEEQIKADYPNYARKVAAEIIAERAEVGILICGTGTGMAIAANKIRGIRAAVCTCEIMARLARCHNNANVLALGARVIGPELALALVDAFMAAEFEGGRHQQRLDLIEGG